MTSPRRDSRLADSRNCQELSALVMALFDGETDELQTQRARNHLLICQTCANRWLDWNRARSLLLEVPAPAPPETLVWRVVMACRGAASNRAATSQTGRERLNSNHVLADTNKRTDAEIVPPALSDQILAHTTRAAKGTEARTASSFSQRTKSLSWPIAVPAAALWLLILQREPLLSARLGAEDVAPTPAASRPLRRTLLSENQASGAAPSIAAPSIAAPRRRVAVPLTPDSALNSADLRATAPRQTRSINTSNSTSPRFSTASEFASASPGAPADASRQTDLRARQTSASEASTAALQRQWREIEALASNASRSVEWQTVAFNPGTAPESQRQRQVARADDSNAQNSLSPRAQSRRKAVASLSKVGFGGNLHRAARLSSEQPSLRLRAAQWRTSMPRGVALIDTAPTPTMPSRVSLPVATAPSSARLIAENFDTEEGRVDEMRSVVDDFRATVAPDETQNPDEEDGDLG